MSVPEKRVQCLSTARIIGIILVVFGHSYPFHVPIPQAMEQVKAFVYTFHMPLFIFISGFLTASNDRPVCQYIAKRCKRLLIPYFSLSLIAYIPKLMVQRFLNDSVQLNFWWLLRSEFVPRENVWGHFWYLPVIFFLGCFGVMTVKWMRKNKMIACAILALSFLLLFLPDTTDWFGLEDIRKNLFYYVLGIVSGIWTQPQKFFAKYYWFFAFPAAVSLFIYQHGVFTSILIACMMIGFTMWIGNQANAANTKILKHIEKYSYTIFLLSWPVQAVVEVVFNQILMLPVSVTMVSMFCMGITIPVICAGIIAAIDKKVPVKWIKNMVGM